MNCSQNATNHAWRLWPPPTPRWAPWLRNFFLFRLLVFPPNRPSALMHYYNSHTILYVCSMSHAEKFLSMLPQNGLFFNHVPPPSSALCGALLLAPSSPLKPPDPPGNSLDPLLPSVLGALEMYAQSYAQSLEPPEAGPIPRKWIFPASLSKSTAPSPWLKPR